MSWLDRYQQASFRGVEFKVEAHSSGGGRRLVPHQFPGRDEKFIEDLGRDIDVVRFRAYVLGDDYDRQRDRLIAAAGQGGSGVLVHPYLGRMVVRCRRFRVEERSRDGNMATLSFEFVEAGQDPDGLFAELGQDRIDAATTAEQASNAGLEGFAQRVESPGSTPAAITGEVRRLTDFVNTAPILQTLDTAVEFQQSVERLADDVLELVALPNQLATAVRDVVFGFAASFDSRRTRLGFLLGLLEQGPVLASPISSLGFRRSSNAQATSDMIRTFAAASVLNTVAEIEWDYLEEAEAAAGRLRAYLDSLLETVDDNSYRALTELMDVAARLMPPAGEQLPSLELLTPSQTTSSLVIAYERYGSTDREAELARRNPGVVRHPGRIDGAQPVQVLSR